MKTQRATPSINSWMIICFNNPPLTLAAHINSAGWKTKFKTKFQTWLLTSITPPSGAANEKPAAPRSWCYCTTKREQARQIASSDPSFHHFHYSSDSSSSSCHFCLLSRRSSAHGALGRGGSITTPSDYQIPQAQLSKSEICSDKC